MCIVLQIVYANDDLVQPTVSLVTQNVYGFADFTTTIGNTVMIFSPSSIAADPGEFKENLFLCNFLISISLGVEQKSDSEATTTTTESSIETSPKNIVEDSKQHEIAAVEIKPSKPIEQSQSSSETGSINVEVKDQEPQVTKKPKKKKNKSQTTPAPSSDAKFVVEAVTAVTPQPAAAAAVILSSPVESAKAVVNDNKYVVEAEKSLNQDEALDSDEDGEEVILQDGNNISEPEYDFLSRQPTEFVEETYRVVNLKPSAKKPKLTGKTATRSVVDALHPTGLVTKSGGTVTGKDGLTTIHETSVIGTYISGKYAQVLQSTSQIFNGNQKAKINPTSTLRILKTAAPTFGNSKVVTPARVEEDSSERSTRKLVYGNNNSFKNRFRNREDNVEEITPSPPPTNNKNNNKKLSSSRRNNDGKNKRYVK